MDKILVLGCGGHAKSIVDSIKRQNQYEFVGFVFNDEKESCEIDEELYLGNDDDLERLFGLGITEAAIGIGYLGKSHIRNVLYDRLKSIGYSLPIIIDPSAVISDDSTVEEGTYIGKNVVINAGAKIGKACIINTGSIIEHDCQIGDYSHVAVGSVICGGTTIGESVLVGAGATVVQCRQIGDNSIVGAGAVVTKDVSNDVTVVGIPATRVDR